MRLRKNMQIEDDFESQVFSDLHVVVKTVTELLPRDFDYNENHYSKVLVRELLKHSSFKDYQISSEVNICYKLSDNFCFGFGRADIILENCITKRCIILELKACVNVKYINLQKFRSQLKKYVRHYETDSKKTGLVVIFNPSFEKAHARIELCKKM